MDLSRLKRWLLEVVALKPGQGLRTLLVALYLFLVIATYLMLKSASKSLFLEGFGAKKLPYATIFIAIFVGIFVALYIRVARRVSPTALIIGTLLFFVFNLALFWWLAQVQWEWVSPVFYVWVGMYGVIATTQVWTLANELFTTREAKRVFGLVGAGGILGAICGGLLTGILATRVGTENLLLAAAAMLFVATVLVTVLARYRLPARTRSDDQPPPRQLLDSLRIVSASPHLRLVAMLVLVTALATKMVDWQFNAVAEEIFDDQDTRTSFFGTFDAATGLIGFLFQALLTSRLLMLMGLGGTILVFPLALTAGTMALIPTLALWAAVLAKGSDQTLKHSIDRSSRELVYLPVSRTIKTQAKSAIDMVVDRTGDGLAGGVQLAVIALLSIWGASQLELVRQMGIVNLVFLVIWILIAVRLRRSYVSELSHSISQGRVEVASWHESLAGAETLTAVERALDSEDGPTVLAALDLIGNNPEWDLTPALCRLAKSSSPEIRARALAILLDPDDPELPEGVTGAFEEEDQTLLTECIDLLVCEDPDEREQRAQKILDRAGGPARGAWIALMVRRLGPEFRPVARGLLEQLLRPSSPASAREVAATAIGMIPRESEMADLLQPLLADEQPRVVAAAARSVAAVGGQELLGSLVPLLGRASTRRAARAALQARGEEAIRTLVTQAADDNVKRRARLKIPSVLAGIESGDALSSLAGLLGSQDRGMAHAAGEALYEIRLKKPEWSLIPEREVRDLVLAQARKAGKLAEQRASLEAEPPADGKGSWDLLRTSMEAAELRHHAAIFRMLCLCYSPRNILNCRRSLLESNLEARANAAELLDNLVPRKLWRELLPILYREEFGTDAQKRIARLSAEQALLELAKDESAWIRACTLNLIGDLRLERARPVLESSRDHADPVVSEAASRALEKLDRRAEAVSPMTVVEKVVALQGVEVFKETPAEQLAQVAAVAREELFPTDTVLCKQDDPPGDLYVLLDGAVAVDRDGKPLGRLGRGDALGTWGLFEDEPWQVTARTTEDTPALRVDRWSFVEVLEEHPEIARSLIQQLIRRLRKLATQE